jgi:hypothetical protein
MVEQEINLGKDKKLIKLILVFSCIIRKINEFRIIILNDVSFKNSLCNTHRSKI